MFTGYRVSVLQGKSSGALLHNHPNILSTIKTVHLKMVKMEHFI